MDNPQYIPIPRPGTKCPYCGLSRSGIYNLIRPTKANGYKAVVKSSVVPLPGKTRGRRLVHRPSLMDYLNAQVVPIERLNLRKSWRDFRSQPRQQGPETSVDITSPEFLSEEEVETAGLETGR
jgi:hypothetical protein